MRVKILHNSIYHHLHPPSFFYITPLKTLPPFKQAHRIIIHIQRSYLFYILLNCSVLVLFNENVTQLKFSIVLQQLKFQDSYSTKKKKTSLNSNLSQIILLISFDWNQQHPLKLVILASNLTFGINLANQLYLRLFKYNILNKLMQGVPNTNKLELTLKNVLQDHPKVIHFICPLYVSLLYVRFLEKHFI